MSDGWVGRAAQSAYDRIAVSYAASLDQRPYNAWYDRPVVLGLLPDRPGMRVLDAGCGPGGYANELTRRGHRVTGIDVSSGMLAEAHRRYPDLTLVRATMDHLPFQDTCFDLVVSALALHYVDDLTACAAEFARVLNPGGRVIASIQTPWVDWQRHGGSYFERRPVSDEWGSVDPPTRVTFWLAPLDSYTESFTGAGFVIERLVEHRPTEEMRERAPSDWEKLSREPAFLALRLLKVG